MSGKAELYRAASPWHSQRRISARRPTVKCRALLRRHRGMTDYPVACCKILKKKRNYGAGVAAELPPGLSRVLVFPSWSVLWIPLQ